MTTAPRPPLPRRPPLAPVLVLALATVPGCGTVKTTGTARSGTEQLLLTNAWDSALQKVDFRPLTGVPVYLETSNINAAVDQGWIVSSLREALLTQGVLLRSKPEQAQWIVEARVGAYGTDEYGLLVGIPQTTVPQLLVGQPSGTVPEMPLLKKNDQHAVAKLAMFAYDRGSGQLVWTSGTMLAKANSKDVFVVGLGPFQSGSIRGGTEFVGTKLPLGSGDDEDDGPRRRKRRGKSAVPFTTPAIRQPADLTDLDSFAPAPAPVAAP